MGAVGFCRAWSDRPADFLIAFGRSQWPSWPVALISLFCWPAPLSADPPAVANPQGKQAEAASADLAGSYSQQIRPLLQKYCLDCHSTAKQKGDLDLERFATLDDARRDVEVWRNVLGDAGKRPDASRGCPATQRPSIASNWPAGPGGCWRARFWPGLAIRAA